MQVAKVVVVLAVIGLAAGAGFVYSGVYEIGADDPHWSVTSELVEALRERSIAARSRGIDVPRDLGTIERARRGAGNYDAMCTGCHLKPGMEDSEIRKGLYPQPPDLTKDAAAPDEAARRFWIIKHGLKMTAMPAWSRSGVDDDTIWDMVALLQRLPALSPEQYDELVESSEGHTHAGAGHKHQH